MNWRTKDYSIIRRYFCMPNKVKYVSVGVVLLLGSFYVLTQASNTGARLDDDHSFSETELGFDAEPAAVSLADVTVGPGGKYTLEELATWERPKGSLRVGVQVGHWQNQDMPEELSNLERNGGGASWGDLSERAVVLTISKLVQELLEAEGVEVDLLPATVPKGYVADAFVSVHADGNANTGVNGFKIAGPRRDYSGTSEALVKSIYDSYGPATGLAVDQNITRRMTAYYAFNWPRYEHAIHPFTPAAIVETGFLTSPIDRELIVKQPERVASGIAEGVLAFLQNTEVDKNPPPLAFVQPVLPLTGVVECAPVRAERMSRASEYDCLPSITDGDGAVYLLEGYASSTLQVGTTYTASGTYRAIQTAYNYFWFPYEVTGIITN
jgi:hypothetical protein